MQTLIIDNTSPGFSYKLRQWAAAFFYRAKRFGLGASLMASGGHESRFALLFSNNSKQTIDKVSIHNLILTISIWHIAAEIELSLILGERNEELYKSVIDGTFGIQNLIDLGLLKFPEAASQPVPNPGLSPEDYLSGDVKPL
jgi:hypothetical protein